MAGAYDVFGRSSERGSLLFETVLIQAGLNPAHDGFHGRVSGKDIAEKLEESWLLPPSCVLVDHAVHDPLGAVLNLSLQFLEFPVAHPEHLPV